MNRLTGIPSTVGQASRSIGSLSRDLGSTSNLALEGLEPALPALTYHLLAPIHYESNYSYPLLVWLHGAGDDERQLRRIMPHVSLRNYVSVGPRGTVAQAAGNSYCWPSEDASAEGSWRNVEEAIAIAQRQYNVHAGRVFLAGLNDGGTMALRLALAQPERFAGAVSIGGPFPMNCTALRHLDSIRTLPLLILKGLESTHYSEERVCDELRLFHAAHLQVHLRQYTCGDDLMTPMLRDLDSWLMEQVTGMPVLAESDTAVT